ESAQTALAEKVRSYRYGAPDNKTREDFALRVQPENAELRTLVLDYLVANPYNCEQRCAVIGIGVDEYGKRQFALIGNGTWTQLRLRDDKNPPVLENTVGRRQDEPSFKSNSTVEIREVTRRYVV